MRLHCEVRNGRESEAIFVDIRCGRLRRVNVSDVVPVSVENVGVLGRPGAALEIKVFQIFMALVDERRFL
jgi:hypothetical protein